ncbi:ArnT family glycosyltransferase [Niveispirillum irakense]|uniref:ArnT family glycosyltransferase n=1 Tax=Niveispirillum irakense TaxID=34011 RepID=UPI0003F6067E|nr:glycosyltransferase family 39 protein [Niveispirillum irakense]
MTMPSRLTVLRPVHWCLLVLVSLAAFLPGFATIPPFDRDESRYVQASRQMLETGDYVDIRFQDEARHKKPVGIYWAQVTAVKLLAGGADDAPIWIYRLPSLIGAVLSVLLTGWIGARLFGATVGLAGACMMATTVILGVEARMAKTDAVQLATILGAMGALAHLYLDREKPFAAPLGLVLLFWLSLGLGILVKGPIILMVVGTACLALWAMDRDMRWLRRLRPAIGVPVMLAVVLPWLVAIGLATKGAFFTYAIGHEFLGKAAAGQESHGAPPGYFLATFWITFWPWGLLGLLALPWAWRHRHVAPVRFCAAWIIPTWIIHEAVVTKLPHYTLPVFPALALLAAAAALDRYERADALPSRWWRWAGLAVAGLIGFGFAAGTIAFPLQLDGGMPLAAILAALVILITGAGLIWYERQRDGDHLLLTGMVGAVATYALLFGLALPALTPMWLSPQVVDVVARHRPCAQTVLSAGGYNEPSMVFLLGTATKLGGGEQVAADLLADSTCGLGLVTVGREEDAFLAAIGAAGATPRLVERLSGFNYSRGKKVDLHFYTLTPGATLPTATDPS